MLCCLLVVCGVIVLVLYYRTKKNTTIKVIVDDDISFHAKDIPTMGTAGEVPMTDFAANAASVAQAKRWEAIREEEEEIQRLKAERKKTT